MLRRWRTLLLGGTVGFGAGGHLPQAEVGAGPACGSRGWLARVDHRLVAEVSDLRASGVVEGTILSALPWWKGQLRVDAQVVVGDSTEFGT
ncbi:MAG: hypothetical protein JNM99_04045 [Verrucomicrobiaceae bacterium]|nr:hypothetical protein [Verrucomicrobiaceae bacterium]